MFVPAAPRLTFDCARDWRSLWPNDAAIFTRARFALAEGLGALRRRHKIRRVWMPAYLCAPVPEAVRAAGLEPALYDIDARLAPRYDTIAPERGDALLVVHYFGLLTPLEPLRAFCAEHALPLIEDCAHALPSPDWRGAGSAGQVAVWSLRKLGPLPGGGVLAMRDAGARRLTTRPRPRLTPDVRTLGRLAILAVERLAGSAGLNPLRFKDRLPVIDASAEHARPGRRVADHIGEYAAPPPPAPTARSSSSCPLRSSPCPIRRPLRCRRRSRSSSTIPEASSRRCVAGASKPCSGRARSSSGSIASDSRAPRAGSNAASACRSARR